jgi:hypothetical protein
MTIERQAQVRVVVDDLVAFRCLRQRERRFGDRRIAQQLRHRMLRGHGPPRFAPMTRDTGERIRCGKRFEIAPRHCRATRQIVDIGKLRVVPSGHDALGAPCARPLIRCMPICIAGPRKPSVFDG